MSVFAKIAYDSYLAVGMAYDAHSPRTSVGVGLDSAVAINGITRKVATHSVVAVVLTGNPNLFIPGSFVGDINGHLWDLPGNITLDSDGVAAVIATAREPGNIVAIAGDISRIMTPILGWESVTNPNTSTSGGLVETDAELRARQKISVAQPSQSIMEGLIGALASIHETARYVVYENDTNIDDANGIPAHSICAIVEGGDDQEIARTVFNRKSTGCGTYGNTTIGVTDMYGNVNQVSFSRPTNVDIDVGITIKAFPTYSPDTTDAIKGKVVDYLSELKIGDDLTQSIIWWAAQEALPETRAPSFSILSVELARHGDSLQSSDLVLAYDEVARGNLNSVEVIIT
ncbi:hypothetical protein FACS1894184_14210 [Clostridia bacterium]|nr:hypothetical protein FACS1894184_14210 [Clostridia bacterium]